jgi:hypothetical protein
MLFLVGFPIFFRVRFVSVSVIESRLHFIAYENTVFWNLGVRDWIKIISFLWVLMKKEKWKRIFNWDVSFHQSRFVYWKGRGGRQWMPSQSCWNCYALPTITIHPKFGRIIESSFFLVCPHNLFGLYHRWMNRIIKFWRTISLYSLTSICFLLNLLSYPLFLVFHCTVS